MEVICCVRCGGALDLEVLDYTLEINEGFLKCGKCKLDFPIVCGIPILWDDFARYVSIRKEIGGWMYLHCKNSKLKSFVKKSLSKIKPDAPDRSKQEKRWAKIYQNSIKSRFYSEIRKSIRKLPKCAVSLEHGCSIGAVSDILSKNSGYSFGIDRSFVALLEAKKNKQKNLDYFVADSLYHPFGRQKFDLVVGLNLLEIIEPADLLKALSKQTVGYLLLSSPYDYERDSAVKSKLDAKSLRKQLGKLGFSVSKETQTPKFLLWNLKLHSRAILQYQVDYILAKKSV